MSFRIICCRFLDTKWEGRGTRCIKKQKSETRCRGQEGLQDAASENTHCRKTKRRGSEDEARKRIRDSHTQRKNDEAVFGIVPGLHGVIPVVERLDERASKAGEQSERSSNSRSARTHKKKCTLTSFEYEEKTSHPQDSAHAIFGCKKC